MKDTALKISHVGKTYKIRSNDDASGSGIRKNEGFNALRDISFEVKKGEVIGIIGPNGAGKSTLLKIIAEVTPPTTGEIQISGKVASILQVGIGFQPELSGYENIFISGRLYGLRKVDIEKNLQSIINMFGFENFLHTPVKYYSSGMYMRLAFALIAHVDADIYLLDEVLSVGDLSFRDKVLNMISKMSSKGKTVLIVTHVPDTIYAYCEKIAILNKGELIEFDKPGKCIAKYNSLAFQNSGKIIKTHNSNPKDSLVAINPNFLSYINLTEANVDISGEIVAFKIHFEVLLKQKIQIRIIIKDELNKPTIEILPDQDIKTTGKFCQKTTLPENLLNPFYYFIDLHIYIDNKIAGVFSKIIGFRYQENISQEKTCLFKFHNAKTEIISLPE